MSARLRRQELRRMAGHTRDRNQNSARSSTTTVTIKSTKPKIQSKAAFSVTTQADGAAVQSTDLGLPSREKYTQLESNYLNALSPRKREKALLTQQMFDRVWDVLHDPAASKVGSPQFRWWVRKMFVLAYSAPNGDESDLKPVVMHEDRPVVVKDQIYDVISYCHLFANHGGRDRTTAAVREHYSWVPKELVSRFVKACPTCTFKRTGTVELISTADHNNATSIDQAANNSTADNHTSFMDAKSSGSAQTPAWSNPSHSVDVDQDATPKAIRWTTRCSSIPSLSVTASSSTSLPNPSGVTLPPRTVPSPGSAPARPAQTHHHTSGWLTSLTTQPGPSISVPMRRTGSQNDATYPTLHGPLPPPMARAYSNGSGPSPFVSQSRPLFAAPIPVYPKPMRATFVDADVDVDEGMEEIVQDVTMATEADPKENVMVIDPALLSEDANASQLHVVEPDIADRDDTMKKLKEYMYAPPLGYYTHRTADD